MRHLRVISCVGLALSSVNMGLVTTAFILLRGPHQMTSAFLWANDAIYRRLHLLPDFRVPKDSYTGGYFALFLPALVLAAFFWASIRSSSRIPRARKFYRVVTGVVALAGAPGWWLCLTHANNSVDEWISFAALPACELTFTIAFATLYWFRRLKVSDGILTFVIMLHYSYWFWQFGRTVFFLGYGGPIAPASGLLGSLGWVAERRNTRSATGS